MGFIWARLLVGFISLSLCACSFFREPAFPALDDYRPVSAELEKDLLRIVKSNSEAIQRGRVLSAATFRRGAGRQIFKQVVVFDRPDKFRLDSFTTALNRLVFQMLANADILQLYNVEEQVVHRGRPEAIDVERAISVPLKPNELMLWFLGRFPSPSAEELLQVNVFERSGREALILRYALRDGRVVSLLLSRDKGPRLKVLEVRGAKDNKVRLLSKFEYSSATDMLPQEIEFWLPEHEISGTIEHQRIILNPDFGSKAEKLFRVIIPAGARVFELDGSAELTSIQ